MSRTGEAVEKYLVAKGHKSHLRQIQRIGGIKPQPLFNLKIRKKKNHSHDLLLFDKNIPIAELTDTAITFSSLVTPALSAIGVTEPLIWDIKELRGEALDLYEPKTGTLRGRWIQAEGKSKDWYFYVQGRQIAQIEGDLITINASQSDTFLDESEVQFMEQQKLIPARDLHTGRSKRNKKAASACRARLADAVLAAAIAVKLRNESTEKKSWWRFR